MNEIDRGDASFNYSPKKAPIGCCICPSCGYEVSHHKFAPCNQRRCPECGILMVWNKGGVKL